MDRDTVKTIVASLGVATIIVVIVAGLMQRFNIISADTVSALGLFLAGFLTGVFAVFIMYMANTPNTPKENEVDTNI